MLLFAAAEARPGGRGRSLQVEVGGGDGSRSFGSEGTAGEALDGK